MTEVLFEERYRNSPFGDLATLGCEVEGFDFNIRLSKGRDLPFASSWVIYMPERGWIDWSQAAREDWDIPHDGRGDDTVEFRSRQEAIQGAIDAVEQQIPWLPVWLL